MNEVCTDNRHEIISKIKAEFLEKTNISTSPEEMAVLDNICFRIWQLGWYRDSDDRIKAAKEYAAMCRRAQRAEEDLRLMEKKYQAELAENVRLRRMMEAMTDERD